MSTAVGNYLMPLDAAASALGVSIYTVRRLVAAKSLPGVRIGTRVMVSSETVARAISEGVPPRTPQKARASVRQRAKTVPAAPQK